MNNVELIKYLIVCPLVFLGGLVDAIAGGGGLITLPAYLIAGLPAHNAIATNKMSSSLGTAVATTRYALNGYIPWKIAAVCVIFTIFGSGIGANLSLIIPESVLKNVMLVLLPVTALLVTRSKALVSEQEPLSFGRTLAVAVVVAFVIGMYDGFYGPGTGTFLILALTLAAHLKITTANGITKVINFTSNITALTVFLINGKVMLPLGLAAGVFSMAGNYVGSKLFSGHGTRIAKPVMLGVLALFFIKIIYEMLAG